MSEFKLPQIDMGSVFKFGYGIVGKSTIGFVSLIFMGVIVAFKQPEHAFHSFVLGAAVFCAWYLRVENLAIKHPELALLDGAELRKWEQLRQSKSGPAIVEASAVQPLKIEATDNPQQLEGPQK